MILFALIYFQKLEFVLEKASFQKGFIQLLKNISFVKKILEHQKSNLRKFSKYESFGKCQ